LILAKITSIKNVFNEKKKEKKEMKKEMKKES
jgi:hypothetical protein